MVPRVVPAVLETADGTLREGCSERPLRETSSARGCPPFPFSGIRDTEIHFEISKFWEERSW